MTPPYQLFKLYLVDLFNLSKDGFHIILGFLVFIFISYLSKTKLSSLKSLVAPIIFAIILEILDAKDALSIKIFPDLLDSTHDIFLVIILPALTVIYLRLTKNG